MKKLLIPVIAVLMAFQGCKGAGAEILAEVNGHRITKKEFRKKSALYGLKISGEEEIKSFLNMLINDLVILDQAKRDGMKVTGEELKKEIGSFVPGFSEKEIRKSLKKQGVKYSYWLRDIEEKIVRKKEINFVMKNRIKIEENDLKDFFWTNILEFRNVRKIHARQIVLDNEDKAKEVARMARDGGDFPELARKYSVTSESEDGGDLGYFSSSEMPAFINDAVYGLKSGEISTIIKSSYGWHIFKVEDIRAAETPKFEDVRAEVLDKYFDLKKDEYFGVWMEELRKKMTIKVNEENLKKFAKEAVS